VPSIDAIARESSGSSEAGLRLLRSHRPGKRVRARIGPAQPPARRAPFATVIAVAGSASVSARLIA
jgi:hypothetical protein